MPQYCQQQQQYYTPGQKLRSNGYLIYELISQSLTLRIFWFKKTAHWTIFIMMMMTDDDDYDDDDDNDDGGGDDDDDADKTFLLRRMLGKVCYKPRW